MKKLWTLALLILSGCTIPKGEATREGIAMGVEKFTDGPITCYIYAGYAISCLAVPK